jgi:hypothetical protein
MTEKKRFVRLDSLVAYMQTESDGDEIFIRYQGKKVAPKKSRFFKIDRDPVPLDVEIPIDARGQWVEIELWDYDHFSPNDLLGTFRFLADEVAENFTAELLPDKDSAMARYVLGWSVVER